MRRLRIISICVLMIAISLLIQAFGQDSDDTIGGKGVMAPSRYSDLGDDTEIGKEIIAPLSSHYPKPEPKSIMDTLESMGVYSTFLSDLKDVGLGDELMNNGPTTVFAPRDNAFDNLDDSSRETLSTDKQILTRILKYHIIKGNITADDLSKDSSWKTILGESLATSINPTGSITIGGRASINRYSGVVCTNGMIYPVDVLLAPDDLNDQIKEAATKNLIPISSPTGLADYIAGNSAPGFNQPEPNPSHAQDMVQQRSFP